MVILRNLHTIRIIILEIGNCEGQSLAALLSDEFLIAQDNSLQQPKPEPRRKNRAETWATHSDRCYETNMSAKPTPNSINPEHL